MSRRAEPVIQIAERPEPGPLRRVIDLLHALFGKVTALVNVALLLDSAGVTTTDAAASPGTSLGFTRTTVDFADAGIDSVRVIVRAVNSAAGSVVYAVHDVTNNVELCRVTVTGTTITTYAGDWTTIRPTGSDQELEVRAIGDGAFDPVAYAIHLQGRTVAARS